MPVIFRDAKTCARISLRIKIDNKCTFAIRRKRSREIDGRCRFPYAAFLIGDSQNT
jgi:hypothetical protein